MSSDPQDDKTALGYDDWFARFADLPLLCERCGNDLRQQGSVDAVAPCGVCEITYCARCERIWAGLGPAGISHDDHGFRGHHTIAEQPKIHVARKASS